MSKENLSPWKCTAAEAKASLYVHQQIGEIPTGHLAKQVDITALSRLIAASAVEIRPEDRPTTLAGWIALL